MKRYDFLTEIFGVIFTAIQTNEFFQLISLILTCLATAISIAFTIFLWYKKAKLDGKITADEVKELTDEIKDNINKKGN